MQNRGAWAALRLPLSVCAISLPGMIVILLMRRCCLRVFMLSTMTPESDQRSMQVREPQYLTSLLRSRDRPGRGSGSNAETKLRLCDRWRGLGGLCACPISIPLGMGKMHEYLLHDWGFHTDPEPNLNNRPHRGDAWEGPRRLVLHQRDGLYARPSARLRPLGAQRRHRLVLCRGAALLQTLRDLGGR